MTDGLVTLRHAVASEPCHERAQQALSRVAATLGCSGGGSSRRRRAVPRVRRQSATWLRVAAALSRGRLRRARPRGPVETSTYESHGDLRVDAGHGRVGAQAPPAVGTAEAAGVAGAAVPGAGVPRRQCDGQHSQAPWPDGGPSPAAASSVAGGGGAVRGPATAPELGLVHRLQGQVQDRRRPVVHAVHDHRRLLAVLHPLRAGRGAGRARRRAHPRFGVPRARASGGDSLRQRPAVRRARGPRG
jgi:hypothetical protein